MSPTQFQRQIDDLSRRIASYLAAARGYRDEFRNAESNVTWLEELNKACAQLRADLEDATGDDDLAPLIPGFIQVMCGLEDELNQYANDTPLERMFFRSSRPTPTVSLPDIELADHWRQQRIVWRLGRIDLCHPKAWTDIETSAAMLSILGRIRSLESLTWSEIDSLSKHNHAWEDVSKWEQPSRERLEFLELDDQEGWYQIHVDNLGRIIGFREANVFNVLWWDRDHEVYVTKRR